MRNKRLFRLVIATLLVVLLIMISCKPQKNDSFRLMTYNTGSIIPMMA